MKIDVKNSRKEIISDRVDYQIITIREGEGDSE